MVYVGWGQDGPRQNMYVAVEGREHITSDHAIMGNQMENAVEELRTTAAPDQSIQQISTQDPLVKIVTIVV